MNIDSSFGILCCFVVVIVVIVLLWDHTQKHSEEYLETTHDARDPTQLRYLQSRYLIPGAIAQAPFFGYLNVNCLKFRMKQV